MMASNKELVTKQMKRLASETSEVVDNYPVAMPSSSTAAGGDSGGSGTKASRKKKAAALLQATSSEGKPTMQGKQLNQNKRKKNGGEQGSKKGSGEGESKQANVTTGRRMISGKTASVGTSNSRAADAPLGRSKEISKPKPMGCETSTEVDCEKTRMKFEKRLKLETQKRMKKEQVAEEARLAALQKTGQQRRLNNEKAVVKKDRLDGKRRVNEECMLKRKAAEQTVLRNAKKRDLKQQESQEWFTALTKRPATFTCEQIAPLAVQGWLAQKRGTAASSSEGRGPRMNALESSRKVNQDRLQGKHVVKLPVYGGRKGTFRGFDEGFDFPPPLSKGAKIIKIKGMGGHSTSSARRDAK